MNTMKKRNRGTRCRVSTLLSASTLFFVLILYTTIGLGIDHNKKPFTVYIKTNLIAIGLATQPNIYVEGISYEKSRGWEFGLAYHSSQNLIAYGGWGSEPTTTYNGQYGLSKVWLPIYKAGHNGISINYTHKYYFKGFKYYIGPHLLLGYQELLNGFYRDNQFDSQYVMNGYYWFRANHYAGKFGLMAQIGMTRGLQYKRTILFDMGVAIGMNFNLERMDILSWGCRDHADAYFMHNFPSMVKPENTDGFFVSPAIRLFTKFGIGALPK